MTTEPLTAADCRLNTFSVDIASEVLARRATTDADGFRVGTKGSLKIWRSGSWYYHEAGQGGRDALALLEHLHKTDRAGALVLAREWLAAHAGEGRCSGTDDSEDKSDNVVRQAFVDEHWRAGQLIAGTVAETSSAAG